ncbi:PHB depolymerase family esterase [Sinimarinibacterium sp. NLF-5-8]|uniref:alpha/beta hydrolase family esterase n=1 Tax=Sinimarinibacterium sp. NLF-5-8 TaxID=2698684 RepID=UPI00137BAD2C|nr:PHB depolymerase family esterase [Sinimarinibacterium sp. NLF-5-8]QHS08927.1 hypothetical protein GT972_01385 [Sinimarinibacterium sp. NLF-5-8]
MSRSPSRGLPAFLPLLGSIMLSALLLGACMVSPSAQAQKPGTSTTQTLQSSGLKRSYELYIPSHYQASKPLPLVVVLHGGFGTGKNMAEISNFDQVAETRGLIIAYPDGIARGWNAGSCCGSPMEKKVNDVAFIKNVIADAKTKAHVDSSRIYGAGFSNGAMMVHRIACDAPGTFTAIAAVAGGIMLDCNTRQGTPALLIQGRDDPRIPWDGGDFKGNFRPSIAAIVKNLGQRNGCNATEVNVTEDDVASCKRLMGCTNGNTVEWCGLKGVGHQWPGGETVLKILLGPNTARFAATPRIVDFFLQHKS